MIAQQEQRCYIEAKLGGTPPAARTYWGPVIELVKDLPDDGTWMHITFAEDLDVRRAKQAIQNWAARNSDTFDVGLEFCADKANKVLWVRKTYKVNPRSRKAKRNALD